jgi:hypothetical protein
VLFRIISHFHKKNTHGIDELIRIDNFPDELMFRREGTKTFLVYPFERDIDANIPKDIREHCTPTDITENLPREKNESTGQWQTPVDIIRILGVRLNLDSTPGMEMWQKIQRILDKDTPRDQRVPEPAVVAPDMKSPFALEAKDIPVVTLRTEIKVAPVIAVPFNPPKVEEVVDEQLFVCGVCKKEFKAQRGLWMHERKTRHKVKEEPVAA